MCGDVLEEILRMSKTEKKILQDGKLCIYPRTWLKCILFRVRISEQTCFILEGWNFRNWYSSGPIYCIFDGFDIADESHRLISSSFPFADVIPTVKTRILIRIRHEKNISKDFVGKLRISADGKLPRLLWGRTVSHRGVCAFVRRVFAMNNFRVCIYFYLNICDGIKIKFYFAHEHK